jgi:hypothetical protein
MDADSAADESACPRTAKTCGPDAPTLASSFAEATPRGDGGKQARSPGRARNKLLKPSRAGMPGDPGATVVTNACAYYTSRTRLRVQRAPGIPHALCWAKGLCTTRAYRAAGIWKRAPDAAQRAALAAWCAADPGPMIESALRIWIPALRCIVKNAAPRPGHVLAFAEFDGFMRSVAV